MSLGLGDIDKAAINGVTDKLTAALADAGPEATTAINSALDHFAVIGTALESKTMADFVQTVENPLLTSIAPFAAQITKLADVAVLFKDGVNISISVTPKAIAGFTSPTVGQTPQ